MKIEEKFCETKFGRICYLEAGDGEKAVVLLHGGMGTPLVGGGIIDHLVNLNYRVISPYLPGHGKSFSLPNNFLHTDFVNVLNNFIQGLDLKNGHLISHSFGASIALGLANKKIKGIKFLVMNPVINGGILDLWTVAMALVRDAFTDKIVRDQISREFLKSNIKTTPVWKFGRIWQAVKSVKVDDFSPENTTIIWGKSDTVSPLITQGVYLEGKIKIDVVSGSHYWFMKSRSLFYEKVLKFLNE